MVTRFSIGYKNKFEQDQSLPNILLKWDKQNEGGNVSQYWCSLSGYYHMVGNFHFRKVSIHKT